MGREREKALLLLPKMAHARMEADLPSFIAASVHARSVACGRRLFCFLPTCTHQDHWLFLRCLLQRRHQSEGNGP
eukprot:11735822-Prorocentrum_lima.AAC.1